MFNADDIEARIKSRPFVAVRIVTSSGQVFDVYHSDRQRHASRRRRQAS